MKHQVERRKCDRCGKVEEESGMHFGGSPFSGWLLVERSDGSTRIPRSDNGPWDFCGTACCIAFLSPNQMHETSALKEV
jgi:hypothetical protein